MGFFKNINIDIKEIPAETKVKVGDVGKMTYVRTLTLNYETVILESPQVAHDEIVAVCTKFNAYPRFEEQGVYIQTIQKIYGNNDESLPYYIPLNSLKSGYMFIPYGQLIHKTTYDKCEEKYERFYKVEKVVNHPDAAHLKRPSTIIRHACMDCAFYGRCKDAPKCNTRLLREHRSIDKILIENAIYFKYDKKNDKMIDSTTTPCENTRTDYINKAEWSESLSASQSEL